MSGSTLLGAARAAAFAAVVLGTGACDWFTTFVEQPRIEPWEMLSDSVPPRGNPVYSIPIHGRTVPGYAISYQSLPATIDSFSPLPNPVPMSDQSIQLGWRYYAINCAVCHGPTGAGNGEATRFGMIPISLLTPVTAARTDGYIFGIIRNGRGIMPNYNRIEETNRWDVVNYVRALQGRGGVIPPTGPVAAPGVTGDSVPGFTRTAPTQPAPFDVRTFRMLRQRPSAEAAADTAGLPAPDTARATPDTGVTGTRR